MKARKVILLIILSMAIVSGCKKSDEYSDVPSITFKSITVFKSPGTVSDSIADLIFSFTDGDGDIGSSQYTDTIASCFITIFVKQNGVWTTDTILGEKLPYLTPTGNNKALKGDIERAIFLPFGATRDTMRFDIYIRDRAMHKSNGITTPEIVISSN